jgi:Family of unknown function (DUF6932)
MKARPTRGSRCTLRLGGTWKPPVPSCRRGARLKRKRWHTQEWNKLPLPPFTESGDLPLGVHRAAFHEVGERFGSGTPQRRRVFLRLERLYSIARGTGHLARLIVFGSFVTTKAEPNDVDVFLLMADGFDVSVATGETRLLFDRHCQVDEDGASTILRCLFRAFFRRRS